MRFREYQEVSRVLQGDPEGFSDRLRESQEVPEGLMGGSSGRRGFWGVPGSFRVASRGLRGVLASLREY